MNIAVVRSIEGRTEYHFRPDNTLLRDTRKDYFIPEGTSFLVVKPVIAIRMSHAGKAVQERFADRYWDRFCLGVLLECIPEGGLDGSILSWVRATGCDHTSVIPLEFLDKTVCTDSGIGIEVDVDGDRRSYSFRPDMAIAGIVEVSKRSSCRTGDFLCLELDNGGSPLTACAGSVIKGICGSSTAFDFVVR